MNICRYSSLLEKMTMKFFSNYSLKAHNTFGLDVFAERFCIVKNTSEAQTLIQSEKGPFFILGGGSNMLLTQNIKDLVIKNEILQRDILEETDDQILVAFGGGENWHECVLWAIERELGGIENLSLIPGTVGAAPIQNIGAYGVELEQVFDHLEAINLKTGTIERFSKEKCQFGYRNSIFKQTLKGQYLITKVVLQLSRNPKLKLSYGAIQSKLEEKEINYPSIKEVSDIIIEIRQSKLPDPAILGNSGSFFKNPEISKTHFESLKVQFPNIVFYPLPKDRVKVPAGWLIEQCGWKGKKVGNTGCYEKQALVLVNYGNATGAEVKALAQRIMKSVADKFQIHLIPEVNII